MGSRAVQFIDGAGHRTRRAPSSPVALACALGVAAALGAGDAPAQDGPGRWYAGAGAGASRLTPDTDASSLELSEETGGAFGVWVGRDLSRRFALEGSLVSLGDAELSNGATIGYRAVSAGVLAHVLGARVRREDAASLYLRAGLGFVDNESELELEKADSTSIWAGAGVEWPFARRWAVRGELASYDGDAQAGFLTLFRRFGGARAPVLVADRPDEARQGGEGVADVPADVAADAPAIATAPVPRTSAPTRAPSSAPDAPDAPRVASGADCPTPVPGEPVDARGCARFSGTLAGVEFVDGSAVPTPIATELLARAAAGLAAAPGLVVEIRAHTDASLGESRAQSLSRERAVAVARALAAAGVDVSRLRARAFGSSLPRASDASPGGRRLNNRIELRALS